MPRPFSEERIVSSINVARKTGCLHAKGWTINDSACELDTGAHQVPNKEGPLLAFCPQRMLF